MTADIHWRLATNIKIKKFIAQLGFNLIVRFMVKASLIHQMAVVVDVNIAADLKKL